MKPGTRFLLAIPVYNEERHVLRVLDRAERFARHILVVNDGSTDRTPELLARLSHVETINHPTNQGYGRALMSAFDYAVARNYDYLITMDAYYRGGKLLDHKEKADTAVELAAQDGQKVDKSSRVCNFNRITLRRLVENWKNWNVRVREGISRIS